MKEIRTIPFDNPVLHFSRKLVHRLDNALFNHNGSIGSDYEPTQNLLVLPFWSGIIAAIYYAFCSLTSSKEGMDEAGMKLFVFLILTIVANMLLMSKHIIGMPTWPKRILYAVFVYFITKLYLGIVMMLSSCFIAFVFAVAVIKGAFGGKGPSFFGGGSSSIDYPNEVVVDDGTFWGKSLHRDNDYGEWSDRSGHKYQETSTGFEKKY